MNLYLYIYEVTFKKCLVKKLKKNTLEGTTAFTQSLDH